MQIAEIIQDKDVIVYEETINLSNHIGAAYEHGDIALKLKRKGTIEVARVVYRCRVEVMKSKDSELYNALVSARDAHEARTKAEKELDQMRMEIDRDTAEKQKRIEHLARSQKEEVKIGNDPRMSERTP